MEKLIAKEGDDKTYERGKGRKFCDFNDDSSSDDNCNGGSLSDHDSDNIASDSDNYCAMYCGYHHDKKSPKTHWICCVVCNKWLHKTCTPHENMFVFLFHYCQVMNDIRNLFEFYDIIFICLRLLLLFLHFSTFSHSLVIFYGFFLFLLKKK